MSYMWLWGCRPLLEEQVLCLSALWQLCSPLHPSWGWSSLLPSHANLGVAALVQMSSAAPVVPSGTGPGCGRYLCVSIFSPVVEKEKLSSPSPSSSLAALSPGNELEALRNFLYVQPLATGSCTASLRTTWRATFPLYSASCWLPLMIIKQEEMFPSFPMCFLYAPQDLYTSRTSVASLPSQPTPLPLHFKVPFFFWRSLHHCCNGLSCMQISTNQEE